MSKLNVKNLRQQFEGTSKPSTQLEERHPFDFSTTGRSRSRHTVDASGSLFEAMATQGSQSIKLNEELEKKFKKQTNEHVTPSPNVTDTSHVKMRKQQSREHLVLRQTALFENSGTDEQDLRKSLSPNSQVVVNRGNITKTNRQISQTSTSPKGDHEKTNRVDAAVKISQHIAQLRTKPDAQATISEERFSYENVFPDSSYINAKEKRLSREDTCLKLDVGKARKPSKPTSPPNPSPKDLHHQPSFKPKIPEKPKVDTSPKSGTSLNSSLAAKQATQNVEIDPNDNTSRVSVVNKLKVFENVGEEKEHIKPCEKEKEQINPHVHILPEHSSSACRDSSVLKGLENAILKQPSLAKPPPKPCKPPRTFHHDEYIKAKAEKSKTVPDLKKSSIVYHKYDDTRKRTDSLPKAGGHKYEDIPDEIFALKQHPKPSRPPPPTLPRRPSLLLSGAALSCESITDALAAEEAGTPYGGRRGNRARNAATNVKEEWTPRKKKSKKAKPHPTLRRTYSDECVYVDARKLLAEISHDPVYHDPGALDGMSFPPVGATSGPVVEIDRDGYAVPEINPGRHKAVQRTTTNPELGFKQKIAGWKKFFADSSKQMENKKKAVPVKQKISRAFSVLRKAVKQERPLAGDGFEERDSGDELDGASVESESLVDEEEQKKRLRYVASVRERNYMTLEMARKNRDKIYPQLFEYALVVGLRSKSTDMDSYEPYIMHKFPPEVKDDNAVIPQFCFPDANEWQPVHRYNSETFSFVLTNIDGTRLYGYCLRLLPGGFRARLPEVYCIVSPLDAHGLYLQVLDEIERRRTNVTYEYALEFIAASYGRPLPSSGKYVHIRTTTPSCQPDVLTLKREADFRLEDSSLPHSSLACTSLKMLAHIFASHNQKHVYRTCQVDFETVLNKLGIESTLEVLASLLLERRVLFTASKLSTLSACVHALVALLYPFTWQHTFIPVLPSSLIDIVCSPTPYIIGILSSCQGMLTDLPMEEVLIVDIDNGELLKRMGDEDTIIPKKLQKALKMAIKDEGESEGRNLVVSEAFMRLFVETVGHYSDYINVQQNGEKVFQRESFIKHLKSKSMRMFVEWFCETQMFEVFMTDILENASDSYKVIFETRIMEYQEEMSGDRFRDNVKEFGKKVKNIGKAIKHRFKDGKS